ncbi:MAG: FxDxF family PEP-CTERM protein [Azoarcus sp.]|jgi:hypothetical protein|nr:FxDxF family PEP-CTERM protein [Azoarcus sp.]
MKFTRVALAIAGGALLLSSPLAQANIYKEMFPLAESTLGGHLYVADPTQDIVVRLVLDENDPNQYSILQWKDGATGTWNDIYTGEKWKSIYFDVYKNGGTLDIVIPAGSITSGEIVFGVVAADNKTDYNKGRDTYYYQTGEASVDGRNIDGFAHAAVVYDFDGQLPKVPLTSYQPVTPSGDNVALVGFETLYNYGSSSYSKLHHSLYDDFNDMEFFVTNVTSSPVPEPETYAMLLAGLGIVGMVARRRRTRL